MPSNRTGSSSSNGGATVYERFGVRTIINAKGPSTRLSGGFLAPEVLAAMAEAATWCVDMAELQAGASTVIARVTGAEAGIVTSGAAAALLQATAACIAGLDPAAMSRLPDTAGLKNEVVMMRSQRNFYDHAIRAAGVRIVEVGLPDRFAGAGVRDAEPWEIAAAITDRTAAICWVAGRLSQPSLQEVVKVGRAHGVPVFVDAAGQLPPSANLRAFLAAGADAVAFSGGKAIGGPQATGILAGRRDLVQSALLQQLDLDIYWEQWNPPASLIDKDRLTGTPQHGIARPCKVGKEGVVGLLVALEQFAAEPDSARRARLAERVSRLESGLAGLPGVALATSPTAAVPKLELRLHPSRPITAALDLCLALERGEPSIHADPSRVHEGVVVFNPWCMREEDPELIAAALRRLLATA